jgi:hypothetical protein
MNLILCFALSVGLLAEKGDLTKEERLHQLQLKEALLELEEARAEYEKAKRKLKIMEELAEKDVITLQDLEEVQKRFERAKLAYEKAEINLEKTRLAFLKGATHIAILSATVYKTPAGKRKVDIVLKNTSDIRKAILLDKKLSEAQAQALLAVHNLIVSVADSRSRTNIGEPYERIIRRLSCGQVKRVSFQLLKPVEEIYVLMKYLDEEDRRKIYLKKETAVDIPTIVSAQFSLSGHLGSKVSYSLTFERLAEEEKAFGLAVLNLPIEIDYGFVQPKTGAHLNQIKFTEGVSKITLELQVSIPERLTKALIDQELKFYAFVFPPKEYQVIGALKKKYPQEIPFEEIKKVKGNYIELNLIPKGISELEILITNRSQEMRVGEEVNFQVAIYNSGTLALRNAKLELNLPYQWQAEIKPKLIKTIEAGDKEPVSIKISAPPDVSTGLYDIKIWAEAEKGAEKIISKDEVIELRIGGRVNILGNIILVGFLILLVVGIAVFSIKISRR